VHPAATALVLVLALVVYRGASAQSAPARDSAGGHASSIAGRVIRPDGAAAESAYVTVYRVQGGRRGAPAGTAVSTYDGRYEIAGLPGGTYIIGVIPPTVVAPTPHGVSKPAGTETFYPDAVDAQRAHVIRVLEGVPTEGIDIWLSPAPQRYAVSGRIFLPDGVEPRELVIEYGGPDVIRRGIWYVYDPGGLFEIGGVAQGPLVLLARAETDSGVHMGIASTIISVEPVQDVRIVMRRPGRIQGRVVFERMPPDGTRVRITPVQTLLQLSALYPVQDSAVASDGRFECRDVIGAYTFELQGLPPGWTVRRVQRGGRPVAESGIVVTGEETVTDVEVIVGPGSR
jgi:hypothetical protein